MDYRACMPDENSIVDKLTLAWFKAWLGGFDKISNSESKIKKSGDFELPSQFITELGVQFLVNAFQNYIDQHSDSLHITTKVDAENLILDFLDVSDIKYVFDIDNAEEKLKFDDLLSYCRDLCSRSVMNLVLDKMEGEKDAKGLRALKTAMISYFLNRKQNRQDSKYAIALFFDIVLEQSASERTQTRMQNTVCINTSGKPGDGKHRDMVNEHVVRETKTAIKGMHSNLKDINVDKTISSLSIVNQITSHDLNSMLFDSSGSTSSHDYIGDDQREIMAEEILKVNPFNLEREKVTFYDKSRGSPYSGLTETKLNLFVERNKKNFKRKFHEKLL